MTLKTGRFLLPLVGFLYACSDGGGIVGDDGGVDGPAPDVSAMDLTPTPDGPVPDSPVPDLALPDLMPPDHPVPDLPIPDQLVPDQVVPDLYVHDQYVHDQYVHDQYVHDQYVHDQYVHDQYVHDLYVHDQYVHDQYIPDMPWPTCSDKTKNQDETDMDCGGATCPACAVGKACKKLGDCKSQVCYMNVCIDPKKVTCPSGNSVELYAAGGFTASRVHATGSAMRGIGSITGDGKGTLYGQDPYGNGKSGDRILKISTTGTVTTLAAPSLSTCTVSQITMDGSGYLYLFNITSNYLMKINSTTGAVTNWLNLASVGGGGSCTDTSVIGVAANADGSLFAGSPKKGMIYKVPKTGGTWGTFATMNAAFRMDHDGAGGLYVASDGILKRATSAGVVSTLLDPTTGPGGMVSLRRDTNGDIYFLAAGSLYRINSTITELTPVAGCLGNVIDLHLDKPTSASSTGRSLYISDMGKGISAYDGDRILELQR